MNAQPVARAAAIIDLGAIERNCARLASVLTGGAELCAVVKADGYGHGAVECARAALAGGATCLAVATAVEATQLRAQLAHARLLVLGALTPAELDAALAAGAEIAVWRNGFFDLVVVRARHLRVRPRVHVKYDTGMGRLGARDGDAVEQLVRAAGGSDAVELAGLWTHFATADEDDSSYLDEQLARFTEIALPLREEFEGLVLHAANSAATLRLASSHFDLVRCGVAIYGLDPFGRDPSTQGLEPALELRSYVADIKPVEAGASVGYGRRWKAQEPTRVGVLPIGYGDGVRRGLTNNADVLVGGRRQPLVGTVSMDNITVDLGSAPEIEPGAAAVLIGAQGQERVLCEELAQRLDTINYEITCALSARVPREYVGGTP